MNATTLKERYSLFWETFEAPVDWEKLGELHEFFRNLSEITKSITGISLRVAPHTKIRLAQGPIPLEEIKELAIQSVQYLIEGKTFYSVKSVRFGRKEVYTNDYFLVCKDWINQKNQIDLISAGVRGRRPSIQRKTKVFGITREEFENFSNKEKIQFFNKVL